MNIEEIAKRDKLFRKTVLKQLSNNINLLLFDLDSTLVGLNGLLNEENLKYLRPIAEPLMQEILNLYPKISIGLLSSWEVNVIKSHLNEGLLLRISPYINKEHIYSGLQEIKYSILKDIHNKNNDWNILFFDDGKAGELSEDKKILDEYAINIPQIHIIYLNKERGNLKL